MFDQDGAVIASTLLPIAGQSITSGGDLTGWSYVGYEQGSASIGAGPQSPMFGANQLDCVVTGLNADGPGALTTRAVFAPAEPEPRLGRDVVNVTWAFTTDSTVDSGEWEIFASDGTGEVTARIPRNLPEAKWIVLPIDITALGAVASVGIRRWAGSEVEMVATGFRFNVCVADLSLAEAPKEVPLPIGVEVTAELARVLGGLEAGQTCLLGAKGLYQVSAPILLTDLVDVAVVGQRSVIECTAYWNGGIITLGSGCRGVDLSGLSIVGTRVDTTDGDDLIDVAANLARVSPGDSVAFDDWQAYEYCTIDTGGGLSLDGTPMRITTQDIVSAEDAVVITQIPPDSRTYLVREGVTYRASLRINSWRADPATPVARDFRLSITWLFESDPPVTVSGTAVESSTDHYDWREVSVEATAPVGVVATVCSIAVLGVDANNEQHAVDRWNLVPLTPPANPVVGTAKELEHYADAVAIPFVDTIGRPNYWARTADGTNRWGFTVSAASAVSDAAVIRVLDVETGVVMGQRSINVTTTPVLHDLSWLPHDLEAVVRVSVVAMVPGVLVASATQWGLNEFRFDYDNHSGFTVTADAASIRISDVTVEGVGGDAVDISGSADSDVTVRDFLSRACNRQGLSVNRVTVARVQAGRIIGSGRSGIDIEPYAPDWFVRSLAVDDIRIVRPRNYCMAMGAWSRIFDSTFSDIVCVDGGAGSIIGGGTDISWDNIVCHRPPHTDPDVRLAGIRMTGQITAGSGWVQQDETGELELADGSLLTVDTKDNNVQVTVAQAGQLWSVAKVLGGAVTTSGSIATPDVTPTFDPNVSYSGLVRIADADVSVANLDPGPGRVWWPEQFRGLIERGVWRPGGLDMKSEPVLRVSGLSAGATASSNLRGLNVAAASSSVSVSFAGLGATSLVYLDNYIPTSSGGSLAPDTYYYKVAPRYRTDRGPSAPLGLEVSATVGPGTPPTDAIQIQVKNTMVPTFADPAATGWVVVGLTVYRGTSSGTYDTRFDIVANEEFPSVPNVWTFLDTGDEISPLGYGDLGDRVWGYDPSYEADSFVGTPTDESGWEPDDAYGVWITPSWDTTVAVTARRVDGFDVSFGTSPPTSATFDWLLVR